MKLGERIREMILNYLRINPANKPTLQISEALDWQGNCAVNRIWYRGDGGELNQLYHQLKTGTQRFWAAVPTRGLEIRKVHTGLPREIIETLSGLIVADLNEIELDQPELRELWDRIAEENSINQLVTEAINGVGVIGDGAFKINLDPELSSLPVIEWVDGDRVEFVRKRGRITEVVFTSFYGDDYTLREHYGKGYVGYELLKSGKECDADTLREVTGLESMEYSGDFMLAVPMMFRRSNRYEGRGQSFFEGKTDAFDMLDEAYSQWWDAMRKSRAVRYIPESLLDRDPNTGRPIPPNPFDSSYIATQTDNHENARNEITTAQAAFYAEQYSATSISALDICLQGLISPSTLGIDTKKLDNAEAQREKEKTTLYTRSLIIGHLTDALKRLVDLSIKAVRLTQGRAPEDVAVSVVFGEYANPSFEAVVETLSNPNTPMSTEAKVDELWGSTKDEEWKRAEVQRIKAERGVVELDEPFTGGVT